MLFSNVSETAKFLTPRESNIDLFEDGDIPLDDGFYEPPVDMSGLTKPYNFNVNGFPN